MVQPSPTGGGWEGFAQTGPEADAEDARAGALLHPGVGDPTVGVDRGDGERPVGLEPEVHHCAALVRRVLQEVAGRRLHRRRRLVGHPRGGELGEDDPRVPLHGHLAEPERPDGPRGIPHGIDLEPSGILAGLARRRDRHAGGRRDLGQPGAGADRADGGRIGAEDQDPGRGALRGELGPVAAGHEPEPDRIGPSRHQGGDEVGHRHDSAPGHLEDQRLARLAGPPGRAARHRAHRDGAQPLPGDRVGERPRRGEHPGGGLAPVDDGEPPHAPHSGIPEPNAACSEPRTSSGTAVRGTVV